VSPRRRNLAEMALAPPRSLSPSKVSSFTDCPLAFRLSVIDRLPEQPSAAAVKGTLVHRALEALLWEHAPGDRTVDVATAEILRAWRAMRDDSEVQRLDLSDDESEKLVGDAVVLAHRYFELEDPDRVHAVGVELGLEADVDGLRLRGVIDRLDLNDDGDLVVIDYKTGRAPSEGFERAKMAGVQVYALLCERVLGRAPVEVRLLHLREPVTIVATPSDQSIRGQRRRAVAVWRAIERACDLGDFRPRPSRLCSYCSFQALCPAFGGAPPAARGSMDRATEPEDGPANPAAAIQ
jgi:putative RecB family exonuclease